MSNDSAATEAAPEPQAPQFRIQSVCECQTLLFADLDAELLVLHGWAGSLARRESAPANTLRKVDDRFEVAWHCPTCGRNTLRPFHRGALQKLG